PKLQLHFTTVRFFSPLSSPHHQRFRVPTSTMPTAIPPITGMLRRGLVLDLSTAFGFGTTFGYLWWYGFHLPRVRERDTYYARLEAERAAQRG
ncbi:hypothetical protein N7522_000669, partial [Penicillium canescens]